MLVANDGSEGAKRALHAAVSLAREPGRELHEILVQEGLPKYAETLTELDAVKESSDRYFTEIARESEAYARSQGVELFSHIVAGHEVDSSVRFALEGGFDLLVLGYHGHSAITERLFGSTTSALVTHAPCSTLVVK